MNEAEFPQKVGFHRSCIGTDGNPAKDGEPCVVILYPATSAPPNPSDQEFAKSVLRALVARWDRDDAKKAELGELP